jgi:hypothetical protein
MHYVLLDVVYGVHSIDGAYEYAMWIMMCVVWVAIYSDVYGTVCNYGVCSMLCVVTDT